MNPLDTVNESADEIVAVLRESLRTMRYGSVEFVIHDGRVVQIDRKEKLRIHSAQSAVEDRRSHGK